MRRVLAIGSVRLVAVVVVVAIAAGSSSGSGGYEVRAIFMNAFTAIPGEDVKVAGVKVGKIQSIDVTEENRAAVVLKITEPGFQDFRRDAECAIRPQSLIGEKYIECTPTQPRPEGTPAPAELPTVPQGQEGAGQHYLPVSRTNQPVDLDLLNNIMRLPYRQRFAIILNELGTGLAGRGAELRQAIRNADPALKQTDKVVALLAGQTKTLDRLAVDSDKVLAPLARDRRQVQQFVDSAGAVATATAEKSPELEENLRLLPPFLRQLRPTVRELSAFTDQATPVLSDLEPVAPDVSEVFEQLGPFSQAGIPAFTSLGQAADVGRPALIATEPILKQLQAFSKPGQPLAKELKNITASLANTGGIERLMDFLFYSVAATNGFDTYGHYLRAGLLLNACTNYVAVSSPDCTAKFTGPGGVSEDASAASAASASAAGAGSDTATVASLSSAARALAADPAATARARRAARTTPTSRPAAGATTTAPATTAGTSTTASAPAKSADPAAASSLLDYLLGGDK
jgi:ABC-type transporter Mla subunit MlaD